MWWYLVLLFEEWVIFVNMNVRETIIKAVILAEVILLILLGLCLSGRKGK
ncbi:MAG: hypothetical protein ACLUOI_21560 [Eisenbergiella sp.]